MAATITRTSLRTLRNLQPRLMTCTSRLMSKKSAPEEESDLDQPVKYSTSKAASWKAEQSFTGAEEDVSPWYQPIVMSLSLAVFLFYFGVLREENDIDQGFSMTLYDRIEGLEEIQLKNAITYYEAYDKSYDVAPMKKRLQELEELKLKAQKYK